MMQRETSAMEQTQLLVGKTALMLVLVVAGGVVGWSSPGLMIIGAIVGLVLGLVNSFKREPSPVLIMAYALAQGLFLGGISAVFEASYPGIVVQAVLGTFSVFAVMLALYTSGKFRPTPRMTVRNARGNTVARLPARCTVSRGPSCSTFLAPG